MFPEWLILVAILWLVLGRGRRGACGTGRSGRNRTLETGSGRGPHVRGRDRSAVRRDWKDALPPPSPEERLRRDYVADRITVEEYERRLDDLYRR